MTVKTGSDGSEATKAGITGGYWCGSGELNAKRGLAMRKRRIDCKTGINDAEVTNRDAIRADGGVRIGKWIEVLDLKCAVMKVQ